MKVSIISCLFRLSSDGIIGDRAGHKSEDAHHCNIDVRTIALSFIYFVVSTAARRRAQAYLHKIGERIDQHHGWESTSEIQQRWHRKGAYVARKIVCSIRKGPEP